MKKLIFLFTMVFVVSMAMGQNVANVLSEGSENSVKIDQIKGKNYAEVTQTVFSTTPDDIATGNSAIVWQGNGSGNQAFVNQLSSRSSIVEITQHNNANNNRAEANMLKKSGINAKAEIDQWGDKNEALTKNWNSGLADIDQNGYKNYAEIEAQVHGTAGDLIARIEQDGDKNYAAVSQTSEKENLVDLYQKGDNNRAVIKQKGWGYPEDQHGSKIYAEQMGDGNNLTIDQTLGTTGVRDSYINLKQEDGSYANIEQDGEGLNIKGVGSNQGEQCNGWLKLTQSGMNQLLKIDQTDGVATVDMSGLNNTVQVIQN